MRTFALIDIEPHIQVLHSSMLCPYVSLRTPRELGAKYEQNDALHPGLSLLSSTQKKVLSKTTGADYPAY